MILWLDLETTGLDAKDDYILEVAWQLTANDLVAVDDMYTHVIDVPPVVWSLIPQVPEVYQMHETSGLLADLERADNLMRIEDVEDRILAQLEGIDELIMLGGFSVHFDLGFIREKMPRLANKLSHRIYDVTTLKTFFKSLSVAPSIENLGKHRAHFDTIEAMEIARQFRNFVSDNIEATSPVQHIPGFESVMADLNNLNIKGSN